MELFIVTALIKLQTTILQTTISVRGISRLKHDYLQTPITHHFSLFPDLFFSLSDSY